MAKKLLLLKNTKAAKAKSSGRRKPRLAVMPVSKPLRQKEKRSGTRNVRKGRRPNESAKKKMTLGKRKKRSARSASV